MEIDESVQETAEPVSGEESSGVSAAEPTTPAEASSEPVAEASAESAPVPNENFPGVEAFDWNNWDGSDYEAFPEQVRPWADKLSSRYTQDMDSLTGKHSNELDYWKRMYEAMQYGEEDPRVADLTAKLEELTGSNTDLKDKYTVMEREVASEREAENDRYFKWFEKNYQGKLEYLAKAYGEDAEQMVISLMDLDMDVHVAVEVSLMGTDAIEAAKALSAQVKDSSLVLEILRSRFKIADTPNPEPAPIVKEERVNPATQVVAGSAPVSRPAQLAQDKKPTYGSGGNERMASLMAAAENAIRKSKRR